MRAALCALGTIAVAIALAACSDPQGLTIEVTTTNKLTTSVEVFIGGAACLDRSSRQPCVITPNGSSIPQLAIGSGGSTSNPSTNSIMAPVHGRAATFRIAPDGMATTVQLIVVGYTDANNLDSVDEVAVLANVVVPASGAQVIKATLGAAGAISTTEQGMRGDGDFVRVWTSPMPPASAPAPRCVVVEHWQGGAATHTSVLDPDDSDCDGLPYLGSNGQPNPAECNDYWYLRPANSLRLSDASCLTSQPVNVAGTVVDACELGGHPCKDGTGVDPTTCAPVYPRSCLPAGVCTCGTDLTNTGLANCANTLITSSAFTHVTCTVYIDSSGAACPLMTSQAAGPVDFSKLVNGNPTARTCDSIDVVDFNGGSPGLSETFSLLSGASFDIGTSGETVTTQPCGTTLQWHGTLATNLAPQWRVFALTLSSGNRMFVPVAFEASQDCTTTTVGISCTTPNIATSDTIGACLQ